jgi:hypothetical protein
VYQCLFIIVQNVGEFVVDLKALFRRHFSVKNRDYDSGIIIVVYLTSSCVNCQKRPNLHKNELNTFFCSSNLLKASNR